MTATSRFTPATRRRARLRMALDGPAGSGKSFTALRFAFALGTRVAVLDTENGSASLYQGLAPDGMPFDFDVLELGSYAPTEYTAAIEEAGRAGYDVLVVDSLSHAWAGKDGALEIKDRQGGNSFTAWKTVTPMHQRMVEAILTSPCHVIATMRSKTAYVVETNAAGKAEPRRVGMEPVQRAGMEYEFSIYGSIDWSHVLTITKSRCPAVENAVTVKPGATFMQPVIAWLNTGESVPAATTVRRMASDDQVTKLVALVAEAGANIDTIRRDLLKRYGVSEFADLRPDEADEAATRLARAHSVQTTTRAAVQVAAPATTPTPTMAPATTNGHAAAAADKPRTGWGTKATPEQLAELKTVRDALVPHGMTTAAWTDILYKRGVQAARDLTIDQCNELVAKLRARLTTCSMQAQLAQGDTGEVGTPEAAPGAPKSSE